jgi:hypothetical protein
MKTGAQKCVIQRVAQQRPSVRARVPPGAKELRRSRENRSRQRESKGAMNTE